MTDPVRHRKRLVLQAAAICCAGVSAAIAFVQASDSSLANLMKKVVAQGGADVFGSDFDALVQVLSNQQRWSLVAGVFALAALLLEGAALLRELRKGPNC